MANKKECGSMKECFCTLVSSIIITIVLFLLDSVIHGYLLADSYVETAHLWRDEAQMADYLFFNVIVYLVSAIFIVTLFKKFVLNAGAKELKKNCLDFAILIGGFAGIIVFGFYAYMPISLGLATAWFFSNLLHGFVATTILYFLYKSRA